MNNIPPSALVTSALPTSCNSLNSLKNGVSVIPKIYHEIVENMVETVFHSSDRNKNIPLTFHVGDFVGPIKEGVISLDSFFAVDEDEKYLDSVYSYVRCVAHTNYADFIFSVMQAPEALLVHENKDIGKNSKFRASNRCASNLKILNFKLETRDATYVATVRVSQVLPTWMRPGIGDVQWSILDVNDMSDGVFHRPVFYGTLN